MVIEQATLFGGDDAGAGERQEFVGGEVVYLPGFVPVADRAGLLARIDETTVWRQELIRMYGKEMPVPRLTAWHGDPGRTYSYSQIALEPVPWTAPLLALKAMVEAASGVAFNSVLLNLYRDGRDSVAWHSDDEPELGPRPVIASVSLGAPRRFHLRRKADHGDRADITLTDGSLLLMAGSTQHEWEHQVPKTATKVGPRVNLTFRTVT